MFSNCSFDAALVLGEDAEAGLPTVRQIGVQRLVVKGGHHFGHRLFRLGALITAVQVSFWPGSSLETKCSHFTVRSLSSRAR